MHFDPSKYETVKVRKKKFYADYPDGRIIVKPISTNPLEYSLFVVELFKNGEDQAKNLIFATGTALEIRDTELSRSSSGKEYESVNYTSWTENCEESAVGRALDNAGYAGNDKCSLEEMEKADRMGKRRGDNNPVSKTHDGDNGNRSDNSPAKSSYLFDAVGDNVGDWVIKKGKYAGQKVSQINESTLVWYSENMDGEWKKVVDEEIKRRSDGGVEKEIEESGVKEMGDKIRKAWDFLQYEPDDIREDVKSTLGFDSPLNLKTATKKQLDLYYNHLRCEQIKHDIKKGWHTLEYEDTHKERSLLKNALIKDLNDFMKCEDYELLENYYKYLLEK